MIPGLLVVCRQRQGRLERTTLGEVSVFIKEVYSPNGWYVDVKLDKDAIQQLFLGIDSATY